MSHEAAVLCVNIKAVYNWNVGVKCIWCVFWVSYLDNVVGCIHWRPAENASNKRVHSNQQRFGSIPNWVMLRIAKRKHICIGWYGATLVGKGCHTTLFSHQNSYEQTHVCWTAQMNFSGQFNYIKTLNSFTAKLICACERRKSKGHRRRENKNIKLVDLTVVWLHVSIICIVRCRPHFSIISIIVGCSF